MSLLVSAVAGPCGLLPGCGPLLSVGAWGLPRAAVPPGTSPAHFPLRSVEGRLCHGQTGHRYCFTALSVK